MVAQVTGTSKRSRKTAPEAAVPVTEDATPTDTVPDRVVLMVIGGIECTAPAGGDFGAALEHLDNLVRLKPVYAEMRLVSRVIGPETYARVKALPPSELGPEQWRDLVDVIKDRIVGPVEEEAKRGN